MSLWKKLFGIGKEQSSESGTSVSSQGRSAKKHYKCPSCGSIHIKDEMKMSTVTPMLEAGVAVSGGETCTHCMTRLETTAVYAGKYDMRSSDSLIAQMIADPNNAQADLKTKTWRYKGKIVD